MAGAQAEARKNGVFGGISGSLVLLEETAREWQALAVEVLVHCVEEVGFCLKGKVGRSSKNFCAMR